MLIPSGLRAERGGMMIVDPGEGARRTTLVPKILVVEDEPAVRDVLKDILGVAGFEVITIPSGKGAPELAEKETPDAILLDVILPDVDGIEICRRLKARESTKSIPVVMISGFNVERSQVLEAGAEDIVYKPFNMDDILLRLKSILPFRN
jgi:two-component system phosphate regulon response regulator PhoB